MDFLTASDETYETMEVCRVCLQMNVKMYDLMAYPLDKYFEAVIGIPVMSTLHLPPFLCYECASLVRKYFKFKERCLQGQAVLYDILRNTGAFTAQEILAVDREGLSIKSNLSIYTTTPEIDIILDEEQKVKEEPVIIHDNGNNIPDTDGAPNAEINIDVKVEPDFDFTEPDFHQSSDDEPLSVHKSVKSEKKKSKKRGRKKKEENKAEHVLLETADCSLQEYSNEDSKASVTVPRKKGRPRKLPAAPSPTPRRTKNTGGVVADDVNLDDYVDIITLTLAEQLEEINKRKESSNYQNSAYQCNLCYKGFIDTNAWKHHLGKHDPSAGAVECGVCKFRFASKRALQKHSVNHEKKYACKACDYVSKTTTQAKQHQRWHKGVTYTCEYCDEVSTKWTSYLSHVRIKHPSQHICPVCGYSFVSRLGLSMHRTMMHKDQADKPDGEGTESGPYCQECDVKFVSTEAYNRHMVTSVKHSEGNNLSKGCRVCGARFPSQEELRLHHRAAHARARPRNYGKKNNADNWPQNCVHCGECIENAREYWTHFRRAHPDQAYPIQKNYVCDVCGKRFRGNAFLTYHKRTHTAERAYKCSTCDKAFFNRTNLNMHLRTHSAARPYPCDVCCKAFKCKGALDRHFRSHTGVKPYECEVCGKAFAQSNSRKLHVRTVHLKQPAPYSHRARQDKRKPQDKLPEQHAFVY